MMTPNEKRREEVRTLAEQDLSTRAIAKQLGIRPQLVSYYRKVLGIPSNKPFGAPPRTMSQDEIDGETLTTAFNEGRNTSAAWTPEEAAAYDRLKAKGIVE